MENEDLYVFMASDYYATGEGRTITLLITRAYPRSEDYEVASSFVDGKYVPGILKNTAAERARREFDQFAGGWMAAFSETLPRIEFLERYANHLPNWVVAFLSEYDKAGNFNFKTQIHLNYA